MINIQWDKLTPQELSTLMINSQVCAKCGKTVGENKSKYCGDGSDKDNAHRWSNPMEPKAIIKRNTHLELYKE